MIKDKKTYIGVNMIFAGILAGGKGKRMGYTDMPKQFLSLGNKPIIVHTIEKFMLNDRFEKIYVGAPKDWVSHTKDLIKKNIGSINHVVVIEGGEDRNGTIVNIANEIRGEYGINQDDVLVTHDAVRPFITHRIINENIDSALEYGACDTIIPATDTIVFSKDACYLSDIPDRSQIYLGQTPQSFNINLLLNEFEKLSVEQKKILTDACKICVLNGVNVKIVLGEDFNIKVTTLFDLKLANTMLGMGDFVD